MMPASFSRATTAGGVGVTGASKPEIRRTPAGSLDGDGARLRRALACSDVFGGLPAAATDVLVARGRVVRFDAGQVVYYRGDPGDSVMMVVTGRVRISNSVAGGKEAIISYVDPGDIFGELAAFDGLPRSVDASASVPSEVLVLGRRELLSVLETYQRVEETRPQPGGSGQKLTTSTAASAAVTTTRMTSTAPSAVAKASRCADGRARSSRGVPAPTRSRITSPRL